MKKFILEEKNYIINGKIAAKSEDILYACDFEKGSTSETLNIFDTIEAGVAFMNNLPEPILKCVNGNVCVTSYELSELIFKDEFIFDPSNGTLDDQLNDTTYKFGDIVQCKFADQTEEIFSLSHSTNSPLNKLIADSMFIYKNKHGIFWDASHGLTDFVTVYFLATNKELQTFDLSDADYGEWDTSDIEQFEKILYFFKNEIGIYNFEKFTQFFDRIKIEV